MDSFHDSVPMTLYRTLDAVMPSYRVLFAQHNITEPQWRVLRALWTGHKISSAELSKRTLIQAPSLVGVLDRMESKDLISRLRSTSDRRLVYIRATPASRQLEQRITPELQAIHRRLMSTMKENEWNTVKTLLEKIAGAATEPALKTTEDVGV